MSSSKAVCISISNKILKGTVRLTGSKSESNRALIIQSLSGGKVKVENLSKAADTVTLEGILEEIQKSNVSKGVLSDKSQNPELQTPSSKLKTANSELPTANSQLPTENCQLNVGPAGTAMRFLTAYTAMQPGEIILTGSERMQQRPIGILVDALRELGAEIEYAKNEGFPPLKICGPIKQKTNRVAIKGNISSQYISALLLIASKLPLGLELQIEGELTSTPYVEMTLAMLEQAGVKHERDGNIIRIENQEFKPSTLSIEPDWSAASYWYAMAALADEAEFFLPGLNGYSLQGDSRITEIMANFGITSQFKDGGVHLLKEPKKLERKIFDFKDCPDLAQTVIVCCAALGHDATFTGLETLKIKETDRIKALQTELAKIGVSLIEKNRICKLDCSGLHFPDQVNISTYDDHRMAMAFAPLALKINKLEIEDAPVVEKSYPHFWEDLKSIGFNIDLSC